MLGEFSSGIPPLGEEFYRRLMVRLPNQSGNVRVSILLSPIWPDGKTFDQPKLTPLRDW